MKINQIIVALFAVLLVGCAQHLGSDDECGDLKKWLGKRISIEGIYYANRGMTPTVRLSQPAGCLVFIEVIEADKGAIIQNNAIRTGWSPFDGLAADQKNWKLEQTGRKLVSDAEMKTMQDKLDRLAFNTGHSVRITGTLYRCEEYCIGYPPPAFALQQSRYFFNVGDASIQLIHKITPVSTTGT